MRKKYTIPHRRQPSRAKNQEHMFCHINKQRPTIDDDDGVFFRQIFLQKKKEDCFCVFFLVLVVSRKLNKGLNNFCYINRIIIRFESFHQQSTFIFFHLFDSFVSSSLWLSV